MQKEVELTESPEGAEKSPNPVVTTDEHPSSSVSIKTLFLRYSTKKERVLLVFVFLCNNTFRLSF